MRYWEWAKSHRTHLTAIVFWLGLLLLTRQYMQTNHLSFEDLTQQLSNLLRGSAFGPTLFIALYLLRPLTLFPAVLLTLLGGNVFGLWPGFLYVLVAGTLSSIIPYSVGRWFSTNASQENDAKSRLHQFIGTVRMHPFQTMLVTRLLFLPYDGVSLLAGSLRVPFLAFFFATALGNVVGSFSYVGIGASIKGDLSAGDISFDPKTLLMSIGILVVTLLLSKILNSYQIRRQTTRKERAE